MRKFLLILFLLQQISCLNAYSIEALPAPTISPDVAALPAPASSRFTPAQTHWYAKVYGDSVEGNRLSRRSEDDSESSFPHSYEPVLDEGAAKLPTPESLPAAARHMSLFEAIALSLRTNPAVKIAELQRISDKFSLEVALQPSKVQWSPFTLSSTITNHTLPAWTTGTGIAVNAPSGTSFSDTYTNNLLGGMGNQALQIQQQILKGFGFAVNDVPYENAYDSEKVARLTFKSSVITSVVAVISAYRTLVEGYGTLATNKQNYKSQAEDVVHSKLEVQAGTLAPSELLQEESSLASAQLSVVQAQQTLRTNYLAFLTSLGLISNSNIIIDQQIHVKEAKAPSLEECNKIALKTNIAYLQALLNLNITKRGLITAKDARKWSLSMTANTTVGSQRSGLGSPITNTSTNPSLAFSLSVPIDQINLKQNEVNAKIAIETAKMNLTQTKETLISNVLNQWDQIRNDKEQIKISEESVKLQEQTVKNAKLQLKFGKIPAFQLTTLEQDLLSAQVSLISTKIGYLNDITTLYQTLGVTLDKWHIKLRY
ncbi:MAG: TolC family protein [Gammaproteobacteria bacterium]|nr:TolC family protein [Gammaproteobacteria bacterium]